MTVSVIIPVYCVSACIGRCVASVVSQNYKDIECVLVDDCSPDDSIAICEHLIEDYEGSVSFTILHHEKNRGLSAARNTGIDAATGDYILFLDGDDKLTSDCIEKLTRPVLNDPSIEMVMGNYERKDDGRSISPFERKTLNLQEEDIKGRSAVRDYYFSGRFFQASWNKLIKRDFIRSNQLYFNLHISYSLINEYEICRVIGYYKINTFLSDYQRDSVKIPHFFVF